MSLARAGQNLLRQRASTLVGAVSLSESKGLWIGLGSIAALALGAVVFESVQKKKKKKFADASPKRLAFYKKLDPSLKPLADHWFETVGQWEFKAPEIQALILKGITPKQVRDRLGNMLGDQFVDSNDIDRTDARLLAWEDSGELELSELQRLAKVRSLGVEIPNPSDPYALARAFMISQIVRKLADASGFMEPSSINGVYGGAVDRGFRRFLNNASPYEMQLVLDLPNEQFMMMPFISDLGHRAKGKKLAANALQNRLETIRKIESDPDFAHTLSAAKGSPLISMVASLKRDELQQLRRMSKAIDGDGSDTLLWGFFKEAVYRGRPGSIARAVKKLDDSQLAVLADLPDLPLDGSEESFAQQTSLHDIVSEPKAMALLSDVDPDSPGAVQEAYKKVQGLFSWNEDDESSETSDIAGRARDRLAQREPSWAITEYPQEYERGQRLSRFLGHAVDQIAKEVQAGEDVVIHGRDGELLYELLKRRPDLDHRKIHYVLSSRSLTTERFKSPRQTHDDDEGELEPQHDEHVKGWRRERFLEYLRKHIPPNAVHVDTGFEGSIPRWIQEYEEVQIPVKKLFMISSADPRFQIPIDPSTLPPPRERLRKSKSKKSKTPDTPEAQVRDIVLNDLEYSAQRLASPKRWGAIGYSPDAPGFWARLYGVLKGALS